MVVVSLSVLVVLLLAGAFATPPTESGDGTTNGTVGNPQGSQQESPQDFELTIDLPPLLIEVLSVVAIALTLLALVQAIRNVTLKDLFASLAVGGILYVVFSWLLEAAGGPPFSPPSQNVTNGTAGSPGPGAPEPSAATGDPLPILVAGLLVVLVGVVALAIFSGGRTDDPRSADDSEASSDPDLQAVGAAAGRAADTLAGGVDSMNAVYRAWTEMTDALDVPRPETTTPGEFAEAAVQAGMDREEVAELTSQFEAVRYGNQPVTQERIERAERALRHVEVTYAGEATNQVTDEPGEGDDGR